MDLRSEAGGNDTVPLVAVVTPVYNGEEFLDATMRCVQEQDYPNLVHVVLDNASTDATAVIIARYQGGRVPLQVSRNETLLPQLENWNRALTLVPAETAFVKLLCADDLMRPDCISRFVAAAEGCAGIELVLSDDVFADEVRTANLPSGANRHDGEEIARRILSGEIEWLPYNHLFTRWRAADARASFFPANPINFDRYAVVERALQGKVAYLRQPLLYTRWHAGTITSRATGSKEVPRLIMELDIVSTYGRRCWDDAGYQRAIDLHLGRMARFALRWLVKGDLAAAAAMHRALRQRGHAMTPASYARHVLTWPLYQFRKQRRRQPRDRRMTETEFLAAAKLSALTFG